MNTAECTTWTSGATQDHATQDKTLFAIIIKLERHLLDSAQNCVKEKE